MDTLSIILATMKSKHISQQDICINLNLRKQAFTDWKAGKSESYLKYLPQIAEILNVSVDYLLGKTDAPTPSGTEMTEEEKNILGLLHKMSEDELKTVYKIISAMAGEE